jgi:hypothetical protein
MSSSEIETMDGVMSLCATIGADGQRSLGVLNDFMLSIGGKISRQTLSLSDLGCLLSDAVNKQDRALSELIGLALKIKQSTSAGHNSIEFVGIGRNPASLHHKECLLVRFGDLVYSYKPDTDVTPIRRWGERLELILGAPNGVSQFNQLVVSRALIRVGGIWSVSKDLPVPSELRTLQPSFHAEGQLDTTNTDLVVVRDTGVGSPTVLAALLLPIDSSTPILHLEGGQLYEAIATGSIALGPDAVVHESLLKFVTCSAL